MRTPLITLCVAGVAAALLLPDASFAQGSDPVADPPATTTEEPTTGTAEVETTESGQRVFRDKIVVTASRREQESADAPAPITVIDRLQILERQPEKMADLFKQIPGVEIQGEGPFRGIPVIRGFSSNRVLILVDGQRLNNARESTSFAGIQPGLVNLAQVERIEVLRGPASVQYGSDAIGGVINIITRRPDLGGEEFEVSGDVAYDYGSSADSSQARASVSGAGRGFSFQIGASYQEADDYVAADGAADDPRFAQYVLADDTVPNSGMKQTAFDGSFRVLTGDRGVLRFNLESVRTDDVGFPGFDPETSGIEISFPSFDRDKLGLAWSSGPVWGLDDVSLSTYYQEVTKESIRNLDFGFFYSYNTTVSQIDSLGFNLQSVANQGIHHLVFGLDFYQDDVEDETLAESPFGSSTEVAVPKSTQQGLGVYIQDELRATDRLRVHLGLRGDTFSFESDDDPDYAGEPFDVTDSAVSGNIGLSYDLTDEVSLNALVARGFRAPNLQERSFFGLASTGDTLILQNPDLDPESSLNYEIGFKARYDRYFGGATVFYNDVTDFITLDFIGSDPDTGLDLARFDNIDKATIWGVELELETLFARSWTAFTNLAYTEGTDERTDEPLSAIAPLKAILGLRFQPGRWWLEGSARIVDNQDRLPTDDPRADRGIPGFTVYDLRGGYDFAAGLSLLGAIENLSDKLYAEPFNNRPETGRSFRTSVRYVF